MAAAAAANKIVCRLATTDNNSYDAFHIRRPVHSANSMRAIAPTTKNLYGMVWYGKCRFI